MGFYAPAQIVRDAREHGVEVRGPDVLSSGWDCGARPGVVRLGFRQVRGMHEDQAGRLVAARDAGARSLADLARVGDLSRQTLELLAEADAFRSLGMDRRAALWAVKGMAPERRVEAEAPLLALMGRPDEGAVRLPAMALSAHVAEDYRTTSLSLKAHPCQFFRPLLTEMGAVTAASLRHRKDGARVAVGGLVLIRQRPGTAKGIVFLTLEDETGSANAVVWKDVFAANRREAMSAAFLVVHGRMQRADEVIHVVAERFTDLSGRLRELKVETPTAVNRLVKSRDFH